MMMFLISYTENHLESRDFALNVAKKWTEKGKRNDKQSNRRIAECFQVVC